MADEVDKDSNAEDAASAGKGGTSMIMVILAAVLASALGAGGTFFLLDSKAETVVEEGAEVTREPIEPDVEFGERVFKLQPLVVNVTGEGYPRYLKMQVAFEMNTPEARLEIEARVDQVRDTTILLLSSKRLADINDFEGKALLKDDLRDRVNSTLKTGRVESVLFTEFVVQ